MPTTATPKLSGPMFEALDTFRQNNTAILPAYWLKTNSAVALIRRGLIGAERHGQYQLLPAGARQLGIDYTIFVERAREQATAEDAARVVCIAPGCGKGFLPGAMGTRPFSSQAGWTAEQRMQHHAAAAHVPMTVVGYLAPKPISAATWSITRGYLLRVSDPAQVWDEAFAEYFNREGWTAEAQDRVMLNMPKADTRIDALEAWYDARREYRARGGDTGDIMVNLGTRGNDVGWSWLRFENGPGCVRLIDQFNHVAAVVESWREGWSCQLGVDYGGAKLVVIAGELFGEMAQRAARAMIDHLRAEAIRTDVKRGLRSRRCERADGHRAGVAAMFRAMGDAIAAGAPVPVVIVPSKVAATDVTPGPNRLDALTAWAAHMTDVQTPEPVLSTNADGRVFQMYRVVGKLGGQPFEVYTAVDEPDTTDENAPAWAPITRERERT